MMNYSKITTEIAFILRIEAQMFTNKKSLIPPRIELGTFCV